MSQHSSDGSPPERHEQEPAPGTAKPVEAHVAPAAGNVLLEALTTTEGDRTRYTITRLHAEGGLGRIWLARDAVLNREVALKELKESESANTEARERFLKEAQVTGQLEHPNIVPVYELGRLPGQDQPYYTMRFVRGETLRTACQAFHRRSRTKQTGELEMPRLLNAFVSVCHAVSYAHSCGVLHRDLKPANIVLGAFGEVLVLDWGLAKVAEEKDSGAPAIQLTAEASTSQTLDGSVMGTPAYMAPEQAAGDHDKIGPHTDIYGLGAILFEILTGGPPHVGTNVSDLIERIRSRPSPHVRDRSSSVPRALVAICSRAMARAPEDRYASASALAEDVLRYLADEPVTAYAEPWSARAGRFFRRHRTWALAAATLLLVIAGVSIAAAFTIDQQRQVAEQQRVLAVAARAESQKALKTAEEQRQAALAAQRATEAALKREAVQLQRATADVLAGQATLAQRSSPQEALLVAVEAVQATQARGQLETPAARQALYDTLSVTGGIVLHAPPHRMLIEEAPVAPPAPSTDEVPPAPALPAEDIPAVHEVLARSDLTHVAISPSGRWVAAVNAVLVGNTIHAEHPDSQNSSIYLWDMHTAEPDASLQILTASDASALTVSFDPQERWLLVESADNLISGWATTKLTGKPDFQLAYPGADANPGAEPPLLMGTNVSADGTSLAAVWTDGTIAMWSLGDEAPRDPPRLLRQRPQRGNEVPWILWSEDGRHVVTAWSAAVTESMLGASLGPGLAQALGFGDEERPAEMCYWNLEQADEELKPHVVQIQNQILKSVALSPKGDRLAAGTVHGKILIWTMGDDGPQGEPIELVQGTKGVFTGGTDDLKFFPDGEWLLSGSSRDSRLWWMHEVDTLRGDTHPYAVFGPGSQLLVSPEGTWFATVGLDRATITLHDFMVLTADATTDAGILEIDENVYELERLYRDKPYVRIVNRDPDEGSLVSAIVPLSGHERGVYSLNTDSRGARIVSAGGDGTVRVWDVRNFHPQTLPLRAMKEGNGVELVVSLAEGGATALAVHTEDDGPDQPPDEAFFFVNPLEADAPRTPVTLQETDGLGEGALSRDGRFLAASIRPSGGEADGTVPQTLQVHLWTLGGAEAPQVLTVDMPEGSFPPTVSRCGFSPDNRWLTVRSQDSPTREVLSGGHLYVWDLQAADIAASIQDLSVANVALAEPAWSADGAALAVAGADGSLRVFNLKGKDPWASPWTRSTPDTGLTATAFSDSGDVLAIGTAHGTVDFLRSEGTKWTTARKPLAGGSSGIVSLAFSPTGQWLAAAHDSDPPRLWNLASDAESVLPLPVDRDSFVIVKFSPDARWLVTAGSYRQPCVLWDLESPRVEQSGIRLYCRWEMLDIRAEQVQFSRDSRFLVCGNLLDCATWPLDIGELQRLAKRTAGRDLTDEERQRQKVPAGRK